MKRLGLFIPIIMVLLAAGTVYGAEDILYKGDGAPSGQLHNEVQYLGHRVRRDNKPEPGLVGGEEHKPDNLYHQHLSG
jgi:hypothetical protein